MLAAVHSKVINEFSSLYQTFSDPVSHFDCGEKCAPYNELAVPFCCDIHHTVPTVYQEEWEYLKSKTDLWHELKSDELPFYISLKDEVPAGQLMLACKGHKHCKREYRAITCRSFPFFPYINDKGAFIGLSYYWEYEDRCWIISNLDAVDKKFVVSFVYTFDLILKHYPQEIDNFRYFTMALQEEFSRKRRAIPLIDRYGNFYKVSPINGQMRRWTSKKYPKFGPYRLVQDLPFPDEVLS